MSYRRAIWPFGLSIAMAIGLVMGYWLADNGQRNEMGQWQKIDQVLQYVEHDYVDSVSRVSLENDAIAYLLQRLDPHSYFIPSDDLAAVNEPLDGGFQGIGVQFKMDRDTVYIIKTIEDGPAESAGILAGDRIITVGPDTIAGQAMNTAQIMSMLKGPSGSEVEVGVKRGDQWLAATITRGEIALNSIDAAFKIDDSTAYVRLSKFSKTTMDEFVERVYPMAPVKNVILDLRGNGGGMLDAAIALSDEFLSSELLITYTEGKSRPKKEYRATSNGMFEQSKLYVIIDRYSASASEVLAGAMQDHNRAVIYGKRSFGKGLVQEQNQWSDGSATRLTVARYFTPNGRSIQRSYETEESREAYFGTLDSAIAGGIIPDVPVARDTAGITWLYAEIVHRGLITAFAYQFRDGRMDELSKITEHEALGVIARDTVTHRDLKEFMATKGVEVNEKEWNRSKELISFRLQSVLVRSLLTDQAYHQLMATRDPAISAVMNDIKKPRPEKSEAL